MKDTISHISRAEGFAAHFELKRSKKWLEESFQAFDGTITARGIELKTSTPAPWWRASLA